MGRTVAERFGENLRRDRLRGAMAVPPGGLLDGIVWVLREDPKGFRLRIQLDPTKSDGTRAKAMRHESQGREAIQRRQTRAREGRQSKPRQKGQRRDQCRAREEQQNPSRTITSPANATARSHRHTMHPPVACLGGSFLADKVCKRRRFCRARETAPSGDRLWHGSAVGKAA